MPPRSECVDTSQSTSGLADLTQEHGEIRKEINTLQEIPVKDQNPRKRPRTSAERLNNQRNKHPEHAEHNFLKRTETTSMICFGT